LRIIPFTADPSAMSTAITDSAPRLGKLTPGDTALLVCDVQERFRPIISGFSAVIDTSRRMVRLKNICKLRGNQSPPLFLFSKKTNSFFF
jgi:hypothetical protein